MDQSHTGLLMPHFINLDDFKKYIRETNFEKDPFTEVIILSSSIAPQCHCIKCHSIPCLLLQTYKNSKNNLHLVSSNYKGRTDITVNVQQTHFLKMVFWLKKSSSLQSHIHRYNVVSFGKKYININTLTDNHYQLKSFTKFQSF